MHFTTTLKIFPVDLGCLVCSRSIFLKTSNNSQRDKYLCYETPNWGSLYSRDTCIPRIEVILPVILCIGILFFFFFLNRSASCRKKSCSKMFFLAWSKNIAPLQMTGNRNYQAKGWRGLEKGREKKERKYVILLRCKQFFSLSALWLNFTSFTRILHFYLVCSLLCVRVNKRP